MLSAGSVLGTGAFSQESKARTASVTVHTEPSLTLEYDTSKEGIKEEGGELKINVDVTASETKSIAEAFTIVNDGSRSYDVSIEYTGYGTAVTGSPISENDVNDIFRIEESVSNDQLSPAGDSSTTTQMELTPGDEIDVDLEIDTTAHTDDLIEYADNNNEDSFDILEEMTVEAINS